MNGDLERYLQEEEGYRQDFKRTDALDDEDKLAKQLCAFANRRGGRLIFGITDDKEIEEEDIDLENAINTISTVARTKCDPPVSWTEEPHQNVSYGENTGDILVCRIDPYELTPHAVLESGNGATRTYYIRTGDESRPISNSNELKRLFEGHPPKRRRYDCTIWTVYNHGEYSYHQTYPSPSGTKAYEIFFDRLSASDKDILRTYDMVDEEQDVGRMRPVGARSAIGLSLQEISPFAYLSQLLNEDVGFWIDNADRSVTEKELFNQYSETKMISPDDLIKMNQPSMLSSFTFDPDRIIGRRNEIALPPKLSIKMAFPSADRKYSSLIFERDELLRVEVKFEREGMGSVAGYPLAYPGGGDESGSPSSESISIDIDAKFGFPEIEDNDITLHQAFVDGIIDYTRRMWDWDNYMDDVDRALHRMELKIDEMSEKLEQSNEE